MEPGLEIRPLRKDDLDAVLAIEKTTFTVPWSRKAFEGELNHPFAVAMVATQNDTVIGYILGWVVVNELHITNVAVHPHQRRLGIGEALVRAAIGKGENILEIFLEVRQSNLAAINLYRKLGFQEIGIRKNYYAEEGEDAILMSKTVSGESE